MPVNIPTRGFSKPESSPASSFAGVPLVLWALAIMLVSAIAHFDPPIAALDTFEMIAAF